jgi:hypothetical protein
VLHGTDDSVPARLDVGYVLDLVDSLVGALLDAEWSGNNPWLDGPDPVIVDRPCCPRCKRAGRWQQAWDDIVGGSVPPWARYGAKEAVECQHASDCAVDAALTIAGYPDQQSRDAERVRRAAR